MKSFLKNFLIFGLSSIVTKMAGFFLIPLYTKLLSPSDYGNLFILNSTYLIINLAAVGGFENSFTRWFFDNENQTDRNKTTASWFWSQLLITGVLVGLLLLFINPFISKFTESLPNPYLTVSLFVCATLFYIIPSVYINYQRVSQKAQQTVLFTIAFSLTTTILSVIFVIVYHLNVLGIAMAMFLSNLLFTIVGLVLLKEKVFLKYFNKDRALKMFKFSFPFIPAMISYWFLQSTDSYFIKIITNSSEQIGLFSLGLTVASSIYIFTSAFQQVWPSYIFNAYNKMDKEKFNSTFSFAFEMYTVVYLFLQFSLTMLAYNIIYLFSSNPLFQPAYKVVGLISLNTIIYSYLSFTGLGMNIKKVSAPLGIALTISAGMVMVFNLLLIPHMGYVGSALATIIACAPVPIYVFYKSQQLYRFDIPVVKIIGLTILAFLAVVFFIYNPVFLQNNWSDIFLKLFISALVAACIFFIYRKKIVAEIQTMKAAKNSTDTGNAAVLNDPEVVINATNA